MARKVNRRAHPRRTKAGSTSVKKHSMTAKSKSGRALNKYRVGFVGVHSSDKDVPASNEKEAKALFALQHNVVPSDYIQVRRKKSGRMSDKVMYYGVILNAMTKTMDLIQGTHEFKPSTESVGLGTVCKWFTSISDRDKMVEYGKNNLGYRMEDGSSIDTLYLPKAFTGTKNKSGRMAYLPVYNTEDTKAYAKKLRGIGYTVKFAPVRNEPSMLRMETINPESLLGRKLEVLKKRKEINKEYEDKQIFV